MAAALDPEKLKDIFTWFGVINQLFTTRANRYLAEVELPLPQFGVLNHFTRQVDDTGTTVTRLTAAFQANQPSMTKTVQQLVAKGYLEARPGREDQRVKHLFLTPAGRAAHGGALARLGPDAAAIFADWDVADIATLHRLLFKLKNWLDDNRERRA